MAVSVWLRCVSLGVILLGSACGGDDDGGGGGGADAAAGDPDAGAPVEMTVRTRVGDSDANFRFLGFQDGDGEWQEVTGLGGRYDIERRSDRFGIAWVCNLASATDYYFVYVAYLTAEDTFPDVLLCEDPEEVEEDGVINGIEAGQVVLIMMRGGSGQADMDNPEFVTIPTPVGVQDVVAVRHEDNAVVDLVMERDYVVPSGGGINLSFAGETIVPEEIDGSVADGANSSFITSNGTLFDIKRDNVALWQMPSSVVEDGDLHRYARGNADGLHRLFIHEGEPPEISEPEPATATVEVVEAGDHARFAAAVDAPGAVTYLLFEGEQNDGDASIYRSWRVMASANWLGDATLFETPGFGDVDGWDGDWSLVSGVSVEGRAAAVWSNQGLGPVVDEPHFGNKRMTPDADGLDVIRSNAGSFDITP